MAAVLGLVVHGRRPLELEEGDVRRARERDALAGDARGADDQLRPAGLLEGRDDGLVARGERVARRAGAARRGSARAPRSWTSTWRAKTTSGSPEARKSWIQASAACSLPRAASRCSVVELGEALGAQRRGDLRVELGEVERLLAQPGDDVVLGQPVLALVGELDRARRPGAWRAAGAAPRTSGAARSSARRRCQCRRSSLQLARGTAARSARPSRSPRAGR